MSPIPADLVIENVTVYPGGGEAFTATVAVKDEKFIAIDRMGAEQFAAEQTIDGAGKFMTPGLWDMHAHLRSSEAGGLDVSAFAAFGVTSVRDPGGYLERMQELQAEITAGDIDGPDIYPSYFMLNGEAFAGFQNVVATEEDVRAEIQRLAEAGAAQVKVHRALSPDLLPVVVNVAAEYDLPVIGHIPLGMDPLAACKSGMAGIEHLGSFVEAVASVRPEGGSAGALEYLLSDEATPLYECLVERGVFVTPTIVIYPAIARSRAGSDEIPDAFQAFIDSLMAIALRLDQSGVALLTGTDVSDLDGALKMPLDGSYLQELQLLEEAGMAPADIITMATRNGAQAAGVGDHVGTIAEGMDADFLILDDDPGAGARNFMFLRATYQNGRLVFSYDE